MKYTLSLLIIFFSFSANAIVDFCSADMLEAAEELEVQTLQRYYTGEITALDLLVVQSYVKDIDHCLANTTKTAYCETAVRDKSHILGHTKSLNERDARTVEDVIKAQTDLYKTKAYCSL